MRRSEESISVARRSTEVERQRTGAALAVVRQESAEAERMSEQLASVNAAIKAATVNVGKPGETSPGRHCHSTLSLTVIGRHCLEI
jgi:hypothetical protein